jgi:hypothetical protein
MDAQATATVAPLTATTSWNDYGDKTTCCRPALPHSLLHFILSHSFGSFPQISRIS